jgi:glycerate kinase
MTTKIIMPSKSTTDLRSHPYWKRKAILIPIFIAIAGIAVSLPDSLPTQGRLALFTFSIATILWSATKINAAYIALGAAIVLVLTGGISQEEFFASLGSDVVWLMIGAFILGDAVKQTGLAARLTHFAVSKANNVGNLFWLLTTVLIPLSFLIPSTSGRAAVTYPVFRNITAGIDDRKIRRTLCLLMPTIILVSTIVSLTGAGSHLVANDLLEQITKVGCGDSGTNDGGAVMAQALGVKLLDEYGKEIGLGCGELLKLKQIDLSQRDPRLDKVQIDVACNWHNILCGVRGVARVFGPQKGASPEIVEQMELALEHYAARIVADLGMDVREMPGSGASGGLGTGLHALIGAKLHPRYEIVMQYLDIDRLIPDVDLVITAEGCIDYQTPRGKIPTEVTKRAKLYELPVIALVGTIGEGADVNLHNGIDYYTSILSYPCQLRQAIAETATLLTNTAEQIARLLLVGRKIRRATFAGW